MTEVLFSFKALNITHAIDPIRIALSMHVTKYVQ